MSTCGSGWTSWSARQATELTGVGSGVITATPAMNTPTCWLTGAWSWHCGNVESTPRPFRSDVAQHLPPTATTHTKYRQLATAHPAAAGPHIQGGVARTENDGRCAGTVV